MDKQIIVQVTTGHFIINNHWSHLTWSFLISESGTGLSKLLFILWPGRFNVFPTGTCKLWWMIVHDQMIHPCTINTSPSIIFTLCPSFANVLPLFPLLFCRLSHRVRTVQKHKGSWSQLNPISIVLLLFEWALSLPLPNATMVKHYTVMINEWEA